MFRTTLIAPTPPDVSAFGVRALSAYLKQHGKSVRVIFLPGGVEKFKFRSGFHYVYEKTIIDQVIELCRGSGLVGLSFMSNYLDRARQLCEAIKHGVDAPLIVGGIHPTVMPEESLKLADMACVGEGEDALLELVEKLERGEDYSRIPNLHVKNNGDVIRNPLRPLEQNLDRLPFFDFGMEEHYIYDNLTKRIEPMSRELLKKSFPLEPHVEGSFDDNYKRTLSFKTMTTRGCPHHCSFCAEKALGDLYGGQKYLRKRSVGNVIDELKQRRTELPFIESVFLFDDTFLGRPTKEIVEFAAEYKKHVGLPFHIQASPTTVNEEKMEALVDAGLVFVEMGIQSTSANGMGLYKRKVAPKAIFKAAEIFDRYRHKIHSPCYHVILDNPWETTQDTLETLETVLDLPQPFWLKRASLVCFPGTELYTKAKTDGLIVTEEDEWREIYAKHLHTPKGTYVNFLMYLAGFSRFPRGIVRALAKDTIVRIMDKRSLTGFYEFLYKTGEWLIVLNKGVKSVFRGDFGRIFRYFVRVSSRTS